MRDHRGEQSGGALKLFAIEIDSPAAPSLLFAGGTSEADWQQLKQCALTLSQ
jgi:hypothetical protein